MILILFLIGILVLSFLMFTVNWMFKCTPYALMLFTALLLWSAVDFFQNLIPGHSGLSFLCTAAIAVALTAVMTHIPPVRVSFSAMCCGIFLLFVYMILRENFKPDSAQYCILLTIVYSVALFVNCAVNVVKYSEIDGEVFPERNLPASIVSGLMNAVTVFSYILVIRNIWERYWYGAYRGEAARIHVTVGNYGDFASEQGATIFYIGMAAACVLTFAGSIIFDRIKALS